MSLVLESTARRLHATPSIVGIPQQASVTPEEAYSSAVRQCEPVFIPATVYADDRGWSIMNQLQGVLAREGQLNFSVQYPGVIKAWHRHQWQTDFWFCVQGHLKVGIHRESDQRSWSMVVGERRPGILIIPPTLWHGATAVGGTAAGLVYYVSRAYRPDAPDEERRGADSVAGFSWDIQHR